MSRESSSKAAQCEPYIYLGSRQKVYDSQLQPRMRNCLYV